MNRIVGLVALLAILAAACGVERTSEDTLTSTPVAADDDGGDDGGQADDGGDGGDAAPAPTTTAPTVPPTTPTTGAPTSVALAADFGGADWEITHGELNDVVVPTQDNDEFVQLVFNGVVPPGFTQGVLTEHVVAQALLVELEAAGGSVTDEDRSESTQLLADQVATLFPTSPTPTIEADRLIAEVPYLGFLIEYQATQNALTNLLAESADPTSGLPCVRHILVETEAEADDILTRLDDGEDFGALAVELSTGPSGPNGGDLGCADSGGYVPPFAEAVDNAEVGEYVGPVETTFGFHVLVVDRFEVDGRTLARDQLQERLRGATIDVDEALGSWSTTSLSVDPVGS